MHDIKLDLKFKEDGAHFKKVQEITPQFLDDLKEDRAASSARSDEFHKVASIPVIFVEKWMREGFNIFHVSAKEIMAKLEAENLQAFKATDKRVF